VLDLQMRMLPTYTFPLCRVAPKMVSKRPYEMGAKCPEKSVLRTFRSHFIWTFCDHLERQRHGGNVHVGNVCIPLLWCYHRYTSYNLFFIF